MNKLAIITGASRGIGKEATCYFARQGYDLALIARDEKQLDTLSKDLMQKHGVKASVYPLDVSDGQRVNEAVKNIAQHYSNIDVLFNSAGILLHGTSTIETEDFNRMLDVNLRGVYHFIHAVVPYMKKQRSGYIFNLASYAGKRPLARSGAYCMTKYGVLGYSQSLSLELLEFNIKVTALCPSVVNTDMTRHIPDFPDKEKILCEDIIHSIDYLLHLSANAYVDEITIKSTYLLKNSVNNWGIR
ncbi:SDR family oxidoreductase [Legionella israelensis]|uniref:SDR family oxidoreductase n=1 Tax=Legionella israelensis TaxID=454 RepID=UPI0011802393|nr:SDR family oxidoreductase [Legionella israelensis]QDP71966.1 SDR family oxidoreductase [Legionella israelensis]